MQRGKRLGKGTAFLVWGLIGFIVLMHIYGLVVVFGG